MPSDVFEALMKLLVVVATAGGIGAVFMVIRVWIRRMERGAVDPGELGQLRETVQRLAGDVAELQERLDFAERMLARQREPERLDRGGGARP